MQELKVNNQVTDNTISNENSNITKFSLEEIATIKALKVVFFLKRIAQMTDFKDTKEIPGELIFSTWGNSKFIAVSSKRLQQVFDNGLNYGFGITVEEVELIMRFAPILSGLTTTIAPDENGLEIKYYSYIL
jgi:hypothetical protein